MGSLNFRRGVVVAASVALVLLLSGCIHEDEPSAGQGDATPSPGQTPRSKSKTPPFKNCNLLTVSDLNGVLSPSFTLVGVTGGAPTCEATFTSSHGVAVSLTVNGAGGDAAYETTLRKYGKARETNEIGDRSFVSQTSGVFGPADSSVVFLRGDMLVGVFCNQGCPAEKAEDLARIANGRL